MSNQENRPLVPMKGQTVPARAAQPTSPPAATPQLASTAKLGSSTSPVLAKPRRLALLKSSSLRNPNVLAFIVFAALALVVGLFAIAGGGTTDSQAGGTEATISPESSSGATVTSLVGSTTSPRQAVSPSEVDLESLAISSVVSIDIYSDGELCSGGSGSAVLDGNYVLTNLHVVQDDDEYECFVDEIVVRYLDQVDRAPVPGFTAEVIYSDDAADLALLRLDRKPNIGKVLVPVQIQTSAVVNEDLFIVGFPSIGGDSVTFSRGIVSGFIQESGIRWIKTDAQVSGGNSGGPAFNSRGELVGVPTRASASSSGEVVDCRIVEDTNGDGRVNDVDACVPIGGSFSLLSPANSIERLLARVGP